MKVFPETKPPGIYPDDLNKHLHPVWCEVRNSIVADQRGVEQCLERIRDAKRTIRFLQQRVVINRAALSALCTIKEK